ncbi:RagB/SusD family nutrient uptake outer membrane protein [Sabulibacter ruber]|uniref:RagB/SusD family nutrient uptake outer membrane protein n=1 Tax=Sabulibacter ruber TaxID=2811901 RepID=UPI001A95E625|nr:RagB/SusD family nutrient uptake outer membrane protein [Sabulibacter ruber]
MIKIFKSIAITGVLAVSLASCQDILDVSPKGILTEDQLVEPEHVDGLVTAAYAFMPKTHAFETYNPWLESVRSDDAYKGGGGLNDQSPWYQMEVFSLVTPAVGNNDGSWYRGYQGISRTNSAIRAIQRIDEARYPQKQSRLAEMRFLRGWIHFKMKRRWKWIPYIDETATPDDIVRISNHPDDMPNDLPLWQKIHDDFKFAADNLPPIQQEVGRANQYAAKAYLAQTLLWMAYPQNDRHQVTGIDRQKLEQALVQIDEIIQSGRFSLAADYANNFLPEFDNRSPESIWELQFTRSDGTPRGNLNEGNGLTAPWWNPHYSCCDFHKATYDMVNAFRVDANGLPLFDTYNEAEIVDSDNARHSYDLPYFANNTWDPRLNHTVGIPGFPWKYQPIMYDSAGSRDPGTYGYMHSMKENVPTDDPGLWDEFWMFNSMNQIEVRYAEVLLWKAEILIQLDRHPEALPIINQIRERAANSVGRLKLPNGTYPVTYKVEPYQDGVNITWTKQNAWEALIWENRLEMAMEGRRFYDLVRWGIAEEVMNAHFEKERQRRPWMNVARFNSGRDEYLPIPQAQINWGQGVYKQNPGY